MTGPCGFSVGCRDRLLEQEAERPGDRVGRQKIGVHVPSECQEMNSSVESHPEHILEEILWG